MFAQDLWHSQIEYLSNSIDLNRKDRAKRYHKSSIFNSGFAGLGIYSIFLVFTESPLVAVAVGISMLKVLSNPEKGSKAREYPSRESHNT